MYLGIDLGTSNSAIVGLDRNGLRLFKTEDGRDVLPSVLYFNRSGHMLVGARAQAQAELSPDNAAQGFKRLMGTSSNLELPGAKKTMRPEEASAEIIRALIRQAEAEIGDFDLQGTIITVPAAFNQMQSEATIKAAQAAGLEQVGLLQEPIAAAMASLEGATRKDGRFIVYDIGGGTFDVALVEASSGAVNVIAHEGINMLGGRDFDRAIVDSIVRPWLSRTFKLPENPFASPTYKRLFAIARMKAEQAKIELSTKAEALFFLSEEEARTEDLAGDPIYVEMTIARSTLEGLIQDQISDSIELCRKILRDNGLTHEDIDRIVFIGGPSKMPIVRDRVSTGLGIPADLKTDPMTAVARGAAIFCESRDWNGTAGRRKSVRGSTTSAGDVGLRVDYTARVSDEKARIKARGNIGAGEYRVRITGPEGYDTGFIPFDGDMAHTLPLNGMGEHVFTVELIGADGRAAAEAQTITIIRTAASATATPATQTVAVKVAEGPATDRRNILSPLVTKGTALPAKDSKQFRTREALIGGETGHFSIELFNQADGVDDPMLNLFIGSFTISAEMLDPGQRLPAGSDVLIHWRMDGNGLINCEVEVPDLGIRLNQKNLYVPEAGHKNFDGEEGACLADAQLNAASSALEATSEALSGQGATELSALAQRVSRQRELLANSDDAEARRMATEEARHILQELARLRDRPEHRKAVLIRELEELEDRFADMVDQVDASAIERAQQLAHACREAIGLAEFHKARQIVEQLRSIYHSELFNQPSFLVGLFEDLSQERFAALDKSLHDRIVAQGRSATASEDMAGLRTAIGQLINNRMPNQRSSNNLTVLAGLVH
jgi:molecular chaperone DnaK